MNLELEVKFPRDSYKNHFFVMFITEDVDHHENFSENLFHYS